MQAKGISFTLSFRQSPAEEQEGCQIPANCRETSPGWECHFPKVPVGEGLGEISLNILSPATLPCLAPLGTYGDALPQSQDTCGPSIPPLNLSSLEVLEEIKM